MALFEKHPSYILGIWKIEESISQLLSLLCKGENDLFFLQDCKAESRKKEWLVTRVLLWNLLGEETIIAHYPDGRPYLPDRPDLSVSISHTHNYVAVYCAEEEPVGIDIEYRSPRVMKIKNRFLTENELAMIDPAFELEHLLICWCAKETLFKLIHEEHIDFREHLHMKPFPYREKGEIEVWETKTKQSKNFTLSFRVTPSFVLTFNR